MPASAYYTLAEPAGAQSAADSSGNQEPMLTMVGTGADVVFGIESTLVGSPNLTQAQFSGGKRLATTLSAAPVAVACWFTTTTNDAVDRSLFGFATTGGPAVTNGNLTFNGSGSAGSVIDGANHLVILQGTSVYLDDVLTGLAGVAPGDASLFVGTAFIGTMAHVNAYSSTLSAAKRTALYQAGATGFAGETGAERIARIARYAGIPIGTLDPGLTIMPPV